MAVKMLYPHIEEKAGQPARLRRLPRIRVAQIAMDHLAHGWSVEEMCRQHPNLTPAEAHAAMAFYWDHKEQVDAEIRQEWEAADKEASENATPPVVLRLRSKASDK